MWIEKIKESGRPIVCSVSGGKDSTSMILFFKEQELSKTNDIHYVFADTGWEHPDLYQYLDEVVEPLCGKLHRVRSEKTPDMIELVRKKKMFPSRQFRFCTQELKVKPIRKFLSQFESPINAVGIRAQESFRRSTMEEFEEGGPLDVDTWRPLISWLIEDIVAIHARHDVKPCSLYLRDQLPASRVGCFPCIMSKKKEIRALAEDKHGRERIVQIRNLEKEIGDAAKARNPDNVRPTFFQSREQDKEMWPIDEVIEWSRTSWGGKQFELFVPSNPSERGCQLWGLCDLPDEDGEFSP
jgi:3'-phosphoadenosine 5'-phosphosulfate sulfotransferase (PAPS reductase)/FAD synthetase